jgi:hypothetical protein
VSIIVTEGDVIFCEDRAISDLLSTDEVYDPDVKQVSPSFSPSKSSPFPCSFWILAGEHDIGDINFHLLLSSYFNLEYLDVTRKIHFDCLKV